MSTRAAAPRAKSCRSPSCEILPQPLARDLAAAPRAKSCRSPSCEILPQPLARDLAAAPCAKSHSQDRAFLRISIAFFAHLCYNNFNKRINAPHPTKAVGSRGFFPGGKEIAVQFRGNSHYRNSRSARQVGMLTVVRSVKVPWARKGICTNTVSCKTR